MLIVVNTKYYSLDKFANKLPMMVDNNEFNKNYNDYPVEND